MAYCLAAPTTLSSMTIVRLSCPFHLVMSGKRQEPQHLLTFSSALGGPAYPIVPSFYDWPFPHGQVPESWQVPQNAPTDPATPRCIVSRHALGLKRAHLVHKDDADWFDKEGMDQYTGNIHGINSDVNIVPLRADLHQIFDAH